MNAREVALKTIYAVEFEGAYSNMALKKSLAGSKLSSADKGLVTNLVYGVISRRLTLDFAISAYSKIKLKKISNYNLIILRMGIYQLMYMDKIPASAAVNESVKLAKKYVRASVGFINGILRSFIRGGIEIPQEDLSVKYSFPKWLCDRWIEDFGTEFTEKLMAALCKSPKLTLRPNTLKISPEMLKKMLNNRGIKAELNGISIECGGFDVSLDNLYKNGFYTPQDAAASQTAIALEPERGCTVIDMCAAPGGKTTHIAELMGNEGKILAFDVHAHKIKLIEENAKRLGIDIINVAEGDGTVFDKLLEESADRVLCDVPCSGLGIIRRKPDIKWNGECSEELNKIQRAILENGGRYLKRGGILVYSTCTVDRRENEEITMEFLKNHADFERVFEKTYYPHIDNTDGFYICKIKKHIGQNGY